MFSWHCVSHSDSRSEGWNIRSCRLQVKNYEATFQHRKLVNLLWGADQRDTSHLAYQVFHSDVHAELRGIIQYQREKVLLVKEKTLLSDNQEIWSYFLPFSPLCHFHALHTRMLSQMEVQDHFS